MDQTTALRLSRELIAAVPAAYLTTINAGVDFPETRAMLNLRNPALYPGLAAVFAGFGDDLGTYFSTNTSSPKVGQVTADPRACVYYCQPSDWHGLTLQGRLELVEDPALKAALWQPGWEMYYPAGVGDPDYAVLRFRPARAKFYHQLSVCTMDLAEHSA
jgi:general stress protein 26